MSPALMPWFLTYDLRDILKPVTSLFELVKAGDIFICYCTKIQRFIGILEVISAPYEDNSPIFIEENDPFCLRFKVKPLVWLPFELAIPIHEDLIWNTLSITKDLPKDSTKWTYKVFSSPLRWDNADGKFLVDLLKRQAKQQTIYPLSEKDAKKIKASENCLHMERLLPQGCQ